MIQDTNPTDTQVLTLVQCHERLRHDLGTKAPALVTLKRWSASGALDKARSKVAGKARVRFVYATVIAVAKQSAAARASRHTSTSPRVVRAAPPTVLADRVAEPIPPAPHSLSPKAPGVEGLTPELQEYLDGAIKGAVTAAQKPLLDAIQNLDNTRRSLMLKYDAHTTALLNRNEELSAELRRLRSEFMDQTRMNALLSRIAEKLEQ